MYYLAPNKQIYIPSPPSPKVNVLVKREFVFGNFFFVLTAWQVRLTISKTLHENGKSFKKVRETEYAFS